MSNGNDRQTGVETHATDDPMTSTHHRLTGYPREQNVFGGIEEVRRSGATTVASNAPKGSVAKPGSTVSVSAFGISEGLRCGLGPEAHRRLSAPGVQESGAPQRAPMGAGAVG